jgi:hypothetical protein
MLTNFTPEGIVTGVGTLLFVVVPFPNIDVTLYPQQYASPVFAIPQAAFPACIQVNPVVPEGRVTAVGTLLSVVVPSPI